MLPGHTQKPSLNDLFRFTQLQGPREEVTYTHKVTILSLAPLVLPQVGTSSIVITMVFTHLSHVEKLHFSE